MMEPLLFGAKAYLHLAAYMNSVDTEICGLGRIIKSQAGIPYVSEIVILPQEVGPVDVNIDLEEMEKFFSGKSVEERAEWCFNWHTHPGFSTNPSHTDLTNYKKFQKQFDLFVAYIINKKHEFHCSQWNSFPVLSHFDIPKVWIYEFRHHFKSIPFNLKPEQHTDLMNYLMDVNGIRLTSEEQDLIDAEVRAKVTQKVFTQPQGWGRGSNQATNQTDTQTGGTTSTTSASNVGTSQTTVLASTEPTSGATTASSQSSTVPARYMYNELPNGSSANLLKVFEYADCNAVMMDLINERNGNWETLTKDERYRLLYASMYDYSTLKDFIEGMEKQQMEPDWGMIPDINPYSMKREMVISYALAWDYEFDERDGKFNLTDAKGTVIDFMNMEQMKRKLLRVMRWWGKLYQPPEGATK